MPRTPAKELLTIGKRIRLNNHPTHFSDKFIDQISDEINGDAFFNYFQPIWDEVCKQVSFKTLLDVGCGNGLFSAALKPKVGCKLIGIDGSQYALDHAKQAGFDETCLVSNLNEDRLPLTDASVDMVVCKDVLEHLLHPEFIVSEIRRILQDNGHTLIHVPNHFSLRGRIFFLFTNNIDTFDFFEKSDRWNYPHIRFFSFPSLVRLLEKSGFEVVDHFSEYFFALTGFCLHRFLPFRKSIIRKLTHRWPDACAEGFTILARKTQ